MKLKTLTLKGFKSISEVGASLHFGDITILLGANGVGKSNVVSFFSMLNYMLNGNLQTYLAEQGFADSILYYGAKQTRQIQASIDFTDDKLHNAYRFALSHAAGDILIFAEEQLVYQQKEELPASTIEFTPAAREADVLQYVKRKDITLAEEQAAKFVLQLLQQCRVFHFHDTSLSARIRLQGYIGDNQALNSDGGNLAAFLYRLKEGADTLKYYDRIVRYVQKVMPQFGDFDLFPDSRNTNYLTLNWRDKYQPQYLFGAHQISDGSLRFMALATLLLQPPHLLPKVIVLDEPELGLHPSAIGYLAGMIKSASQHAQILIATQSQRMVDEFDLENIVVVEHDKRTHSTFFSYKTEAELVDWLEEYSLSELWEKNVIGGQP